MRVFHIFGILCEVLRCTSTYVAKCRVKLGEGGMDALVTLGAGDMRRTLNILQVPLFQGYVQVLPRILRPQ